MKLVYYDKVANLTAPLMLHRAKILRVNPLESNIDFLKDLDRQNPESFYKAYELSQGVLIRSIGQANVRR